MINFLVNFFQIQSLTLWFATFITLLVSGVTVKAGSSFQQVDIGTDGAPRGYWEFLPDSYEANPDQKDAVVFFFHGLGEGGNGTTELANVLKHGPPKILNDASHPLNSLFNDRGVIVLSPQVTASTWWNERHIRPFLDYALGRYSIDPNRIYFTGLSAGSSGINEFLNDDPNANQLAGALTVAVRGRVNETTGAEAGAEVPYWALTAIGDASNTAIRSVNAIAGHLQGTGPTDVMASYPGSDLTRTALFDPDDGWTWTDGVNASENGFPKLTLYPGSNHNSWDQTYNNIETWDWLLAQNKTQIPEPSGAALFFATVSAIFVRRRSFSRQ